MKLFTSIIFLLSSSAVWAQTACPNGVAPGSPQCGPDSGTSRDDASLSPPRLTGEWLKTWGAIASSDNGDIGSSTGKLSENEAKMEALKVFSDFGNSDCKVHFTYKNQCVAVVQAAKGRTGGKIISAATEEIAKKDALDECLRESGAKCYVRGTDCSKPFFRKF